MTSSDVDARGEAAAAAEGAATAVPSLKLGQDAQRWLLRLVSLFLFLAFWQWYGSRPDTFAVATPAEVFPTLWESLLDGELLVAFAGTLQAMSLGFVLAATIGISIGVLVAVSEWARDALDPLVNALLAAPISIFIPVIGVYIGLGLRGRVFLVFMWAVFVIIINTAAGVREADRNLLETARSFCASRRQLYMSVVLPAAFPYVMVGLRLGVGRAIRGAVTAELLLAVANLGEYLISAGSTFNMPKLLAGIVFIILMGLALMQGAEWIERRALRWRTGR